MSPDFSKDPAFHLMYSLAASIFAEVHDKRGALDDSLNQRFTRLGAMSRLFMHYATFPAAGSATDENMDYARARMTRALLRENGQGLVSDADLEHYLSILQRHSQKNALPLDVNYSAEDGFVPSTQRECSVTE